MYDRLPDGYYTNQSLDGSVPQYGQPMSPVFYQGEDILLGIYLSHNNVPITKDKYNLHAIIKDNQFSREVDFKAVLDVHIFEANAPGFYNLCITSTDTRNWAAGTYFIDFVATQKTGTGAPKDIGFIAASRSFLFEYGVSSPNPETQGYPKEVYLDNISPTYPNSVTTHIL